MLVSQNSASSEKFRRGVVAIMTAILVVTLLAFVAFAVDLGYMAVVRNELQNAADAAALAGAQKLMSRDLLQGSATQALGMSDARTQAVTFAGLNTGGGTYLALDRNDANLASGDIVIGRIENPGNVNESMSFGAPPYNSVQVRVHRDDVRNGALDLFFARVMGQDEKQMQITATATAQGNIRGFKIRGGSDSAATSKLLPFALDRDIWDDLINGNGSDDWQYDPDTNAYSAGSDGIKETRLYPNKGISSGNFGTIDIGSASNSTSEIARQILNGPNASDFAYYTNGEFAVGSDGYLTVTGDTGISAGFADALLAIRGQPRVIPLFESPVTGTGNGSIFKIVGFAGVVITDVQLTVSDSQKQITIQPEYVIDPTAMGGGTANSSRYVYKGIAITR